GAVVALLDRPLVLVQIDRVVRARLHARAAADARISIDIHDPVRSLLEGVDRADLHARRVVAVVAAQNREVTTDLGIRPVLDVLHPRAEVPDRDIVLRLAGDRAGVAADAAVVVDEEAVLHAWGWLRGRQRYTGSVPESPVSSGYAWCD